MINQGLAEGHQLLARAVQGDEEAAAAFVKRYSRQVAMEIRARLGSVQVRRAIDTVDLSQSVFREFFVGLREGRLELRGPQETLSLLLTITRGKVLQGVRYHQAARRDCRRVTDLDAAATAPVRSDLACPQRRVEIDEDLRWARKYFDDSSFEALRMRADGYAWQQIGERFGCTPDAIRMRTERAASTARDARRKADESAHDRARRPFDPPDAVAGFASGSGQPVGAV